MAKSGPAKKRRNLKLARAKKEAQKAAKKEAQFAKSLPQITENDLLAFQFAHFGDDAKPEKWFVTPESAINFEPEYEDDLGYYDDGVKRTLTDEEVAVFRHRELWDLEREQLRLATEAAERAEQDLAAKPGHDLGEEVPSGARSPLSDVSSLEDEFISDAARKKMQQLPRAPSLQRAPPLPRAPSRAPSQASRPESISTNESGPRRARGGAQEVPYDERRKRQWESYIEENDPIEGSLTHRRMARELDNQKEESIEMDY